MSWRCKKLVMLANAPASQWTQAVVPAMEVSTEELNYNNNSDTIDTMETAHFVSCNYQNYDNDVGDHQNNLDASHKNEEDRAMNSLISPHGENVECEQISYHEYLTALDSKAPEIDNKSPNETKSSFPRSLVPEYDSDISTSEKDDDEPIKTIPQCRSSSSSYSSSSSSSSSSSLDSNSSSRSPSPTYQQTAEKNVTAQTRELIDIGPTNMQIIESESDFIENTPESTLQMNPREKRGDSINPVNKTPPIYYVDESDFDDDVADPSYGSTDKFSSNAAARLRNLIIPSSSDSSDSDLETEQRGRKRTQNMKNWKQNKAKRLRNHGRSYTTLSSSKKIINSRCLKVPCTKECRQKCTEKIDDYDRYELFNEFWKLGDLGRQRAYINSCMVDVKPKYKYTNANKPRKPNKAYYFTINNTKVRVCKVFFRSTLDVSDKMIFTTQTKINNHGMALDDMRGKHGNQKKLSAQLINDIKKHIESIPRIESHYLRASTTRQYIDGGKNIKELYDDFTQEQIENNRETSNYIAYYKIFNNEYNLSFFTPKKDQCDTCTSYLNANEEQKINLEEKYKKHLIEKDLCRKEKNTDRKNINDDNIVAIYDLEAVLQCPRGNSSAFYYKSKLNSYNLTVTELTNKDTKKQAYDNVHCYFWTESDAKRGAIEIGTCIWNYLQNISSQCESNADCKNVIFYSDNCCGQNKNKYIATLYMYAVHHLNIKSITHKFLIRGHTQNEADSVHSLIEKEVKKNLKSGPIYSPDQYITLIKSAKKSKPAINVHELTFESMMNLKVLQEDWGYNFNTDINSQNVNWNDIKQLKMTKADPFSFYYKTSYEENVMKEVNVRNKRKKMKNISEVEIKNAYTQRQELSANKKKDLKELLTKRLIPSYYENFYNSII